MNKRLSAALVLSVLGTGLPTVAASQYATDSRTVKVHVDYTGSGTVDAKHKIFVALWDTPDFVSSTAGAGVRPVDVKSLDSKSGTVTFSHVQKVPAYASAAYESSGAWDGNSGPPPSGTSVGMFSNSPGKPGPIDVAAGKTATVKITFDDTTKLP